MSGTTNEGEVDCWCCCNQQYRETCPRDTTYRVPATARRHDVNNVIVMQEKNPTVDNNVSQNFSPPS